MGIERLEKVRGHWRVTSFYNEQDGSLFCIGECIFCQFRTQASDLTSRLAEMAEHEKTHPREAEAREFYKFRQGLHAAAMDESFFYGLDAYQFSDREEWEIHHSRHRFKKSEMTWGEYMTAVIMGAKVWEQKSRPTTADYVESVRLFGRLKTRAVSKSPTNRGRMAH